MSQVKRHRSLPRFLLPLLVLAFAALLVWQLPFFHLQQVEVTELRSLNEDAVIKASGLDEGQHLFLGLGGSFNQIIHLRYPNVETNLTKAFPVIKSATAQLRFPGKISLSIVERLEVAYVSIPDGCVMIDKEGVALKILTEKPGDIPIFEGVTVTSLILGQPLEVDVPTAMNSAITLMGAIIDADKDTRTKDCLLPQIRKIRPISGRKLYLTVILPNTGEEMSVLAETGQNQTEDMLWLRFALMQGAFDSQGKGVLDLTGNRKTFTPD